MKTATQARDKKVFALGFLLPLTLSFIALGIYRVVRWVRFGEDFPVLAGVGGAGGFLALWLWILRQDRATKPPSSQ